MSAADLLISHVPGILNEYHRALQESGSPLVATPDRWRQCQEQAEEILCECASALRGTFTWQPSLHERTREIGVRRALQHVPISESIQAGMTLWRATIPVLRQILSSESAIEDAMLLVAAIDALRQSIEVRLYIGAAAHENTSLARLILSDEERTPQLAPAEAVQNDADAAGYASLTVRERQVLHGVVQAQSNRLIARELGISEATVKRHLRNIFSKLGATSRVDAINKAGIAALTGARRTGSSCR